VILKLRLPAPPGLFRPVEPEASAFDEFPGKVSARAFERCDVFGL
jgi:hypothetical protein